jgi:hypothetical protein
MSRSYTDFPVKKSVVVRVISEICVQKVLITPIPNEPVFSRPGCGGIAMRHDLAGLLFVLMATVSACSVSPAAEVEATPSPTATPLPADVPLDLARVPLPAETTGRLLLSQIPGFEDASTLPAEDAPTAIVRGVYDLIPVATADGALGAESNGFTATAVPEQIARRNQQGEIETLTLDQQAEGDYWRYANADSGAEQFIPKTVKRPDANPVYLAVSRNLDDLGVAYFVAVDKQGNITRYAPAVLEKGGDGQVPALAWQTDGGQWQTRGHEALTADHVSDLKANQDQTVWSQSNDPKLNALRLEQYAFTDAEGVVHAYPAEQIAWLPLLAEGQYQPGADGEEVYGLTMLLGADGQPEFVRAKGQTEWQAVEALEQETPHHSPVYAAKIFYNGQETERMFILLAGKAAGVNEILDENGHDVAVLGEGLRYVFGEKGWVRELPFTEEQAAILESVGIVTESDKIRIPAVDGYIDLPVEEADKVVITEEQITARGVTIFEKRDGQWAATEVLQYTLAATKEEAINHQLPWEFVSGGGPGKIAKLRAAPFPPEVMTGMDVVLVEHHIRGRVTKKLSWSDDARQFFENNPGLLPVKTGGYFTFEYTDKEFNWGPKIISGGTWIWAVSGGETRGVTIEFPTDDLTLVNYPNEFWPFGFREGKITHPLVGRISKDPIINGLLQQWVDNNEPPAQIEEHLLVGELGEY